MNQLQRLGLGDRVSGRIHTCEGAHNLCSDQRCRKFAGFIIDILNENVLVRGKIGTRNEDIEMPIPKRWVYKVNPGEIDSSRFATNVLANFVRPRESKE